MDVEVRHRVARDLPDVHHEAISALVVRIDPFTHEALAARHGLRGDEDVDEISAMFGPHCIGIGDVTLRDHQHVRRRLRIEVPERIAELGVGHRSRGDLLGHDSAEQAVAHLCEPTRVDDDLDSDFARLVGEARATDAVRERVRERHLRESAAADATILGVALDLAEEGADVTVSTDIGRSVSGRITLVATDALAIGPSYIPVRAVVTIRRPPSHHSVVAPSGQRAPARDTTFAVLLAELALNRPRIAIGARGEAGLLTGELRSAGANLVTLLVDGAPPTTVYVSVASLSLVTLLASG